MAAAVEAGLRAAIGRRGPIHWSEVVEASLYGPDGFYTAGGGAGRTRDFLTSPEVGPLFGALVARAIDAAWRDWGSPDRWVVVEAGAGTGTLAAAVLDAGPDCGRALHYVAVESSAPLRSEAAVRLRAEHPAQLHGPGPSVTVVEHLPAGPVTGLVLANELLDNLPFDVFRRGEGEWLELLVGVSPDGTLTEIPVPADPAVAVRLDSLVPGAAPGSEIPWQTGAAAWLRQARSLVERGRVTVVDYARTTAEMAALPRGAWLRTYRSGGPGDEPLSRLGEQDVTVDLALDQLAAVATPTRVTDQRTWLAGLGLAALRADAAARWRAGAPAGDLDALRARATAADADRLSAPDGLGAFAVCEWDRR